jgi:catalase
MDTPGDLPQQLVDVIEDIFDVHPFRPVHAKGTFVRGTFTATPGAKGLTRAAHMQGDPIQVIARFSNDSGHPRSSDAASGVRGMAVKFRLADGRETDLVAMSRPAFPVRTPEAFLELLRVVRAKDPAALERFQLAHPESRRWFELEAQEAKRRPASFARLTYHAIHAFRFTNHAGDDRFARYSWKPGDGVATIPASKAEALGPDYLVEELRTRLKGRGSAQFRLHLELARPGDDVDDPTAEWSGGGQSVTAGTLVLTEVVPADETVDDKGDKQVTGEALVFDPTRVPDGIACSGDRILHARAAAYAESAARRQARPIRSREAAGGARGVPDRREADAHQPDVQIVVGPLIIRP